MWNIKHDISSPKFYKILIKTELKGDTDLDLKNTHHFQCGGRRRGLPLGIRAGGGTGGMEGRREQRQQMRYYTDGGEEDTDLR